ncbi:MAG: Por secretion system protein, partial [Bacteroidales bacterium]
MKISTTLPAFLLFICYWGNLFGSAPIMQQPSHSIYTYGNILDIQQKGSSFDGGFSDQGAWVAFSLPEKNTAVNGFHGPFELNNRKWLSNILLEVGFTDNI